MHASDHAPSLGTSARPGPRRSSRYLVDAGRGESTTGPQQCRSEGMNDGVCAARAAELLQRADIVDSARLLASVAPASGFWLNARPCANLGLRLGNEELRIALGLRLGTRLVRAHRCI
jgi:hypothetical protein